MYGVYVWILYVPAVCMVCMYGFCMYQQYVWCVCMDFVYTSSTYMHHDMYVMCMCVHSFACVYVLAVCSTYVFVYSKYT